jgi:carbamoyltransferase
MDLAASIQQITEDIVLKTARHLRSRTGQKHLVLAGGVALNCVANGKLAAAGIFDGIWIQPAAGDAGGALGAALLAHHCYFDAPRPQRSGSGDAQRGSYLGPGYSSEEIIAFLDRKA